MVPQMDMFGEPEQELPIDDSSWLQRLPPSVRLGTCSWSYKDWLGVFYSEDAKPAQYLQQYATHYRAVEIDSSFYGTPPRKTVVQWAEKTPAHFRFTAKMPRVISHDAQLVGCEGHLAEFVEVMSDMGEKLGPVLLQFPYYAKANRPPLDEFVGKLDAFLAQVPPHIRMAVEVRNRTWLAPPLLECLRSHRAALALIDHPWMPRPEEIRSPEQLVTADFLYVRWLGDRRAMEEQTKRWNKTVLDRRSEIDTWVEILQKLTSQDSITVLWGFFNNHFGGFSPDSIRMFAEQWSAQAVQNQE